MEILTRDFGKIEIDKSDIITFEAGIPGFEDLKDFILLPLAADSDDSPFIMLQSIEKENIAFVTVEPGNFIGNYEFEINEKTEKKLKIESIDNILILNVITLKDNIKASTANLSAPIVINLAKNLAKQIILDDQRYKIKYEIFAASEKEVEK